MATQPPSDVPVTEFAGQLFFRLWRASHTRAADAFEAIGLTPALFGLRACILQVSLMPLAYPSVFV